MSLAEFPMVLILAGITAYAVLGGADFGAGFWSFRPGRRGDAIRDYAHKAMGPVWEANHVWLVFVLVILWTAYPSVFGSIFSTLAVPLFIAAVGIILRGSAYALRVGTGTARQQRAVDVVFSLSSILTPFAFGIAIGGIASGRVPVGNAEGDFVTSWLNPTSIFVGVLAVAVAAYIAAVYLAADARRLGDTDMAVAFRTRALVIGFVAGAIALGGLPIVRSDARPLFDGLTTGAGLAAVLVSAAAGGATLLLVWLRRFEPARVTGAAAVGAVVVGWALAQRPEILPGLTIEEAAAGRSTLIAVSIAAAIGFVLLAPSLLVLYGLLLSGRFDAEPVPEEPRAEPVSPPGLRLAPVAAVLFVIGAVLTLFFDSPLPIAVGISCLLAFLVCGFFVLAAPARQQ